MEVYRYMSDPPPEGKTFRQKDNLNRFGRWVEALNKILGTNQTEIAQRAGIAKSTVSTATRYPQSPTKETIVALAEKYRLLAELKGIALPVGWETFFGVAWLESSEIIGGADQALESLEAWAAVIEESEIMRRQVTMLKRKRLSAELLTILEENEKLKKENERFRKMIEGNP